MLIYTRHDPRFYDRRLHKGGGDGGAGQMRADELARQEKVAKAIDAINSRFGIGNQAAMERRTDMYGNIADAVQQTAMRDVDRQFTNASRRNTFGLARSGLLGGSADAESGGELATLYGEGKLKAAQAGQQAGADLRSTDERTRQNLISLAQSGLDTGTAASMASAQMASAADAARGATGAASVGRLFDDLSQAYVTNQIMQARYPTAGQPQSSGYRTGVFAPSRYTGTEQR